MAWIPPSLWDGSTTYQGLTLERNELVHDHFSSRDREPIEVHLFRCVGCVMEDKYWVHGTRSGPARETYRELSTL